MNLRILTILLAVIGLSSAALTIWAIQVSQGDHFLHRFVGIGGINFLFLGILWLGYTIYAMNWLVPRTDAFVDPELSEQLQLRGDFMFYRAHRLLLYGGSAACRWCNRRVHNGRSQPEFDFRRLPSNLRIPLAVHFHAMWLLCLFMLSGFAALKLADIWGLSV